MPQTDRPDTERDRLDADHRYNEALTALDRALLHPHDRETDSLPPDTDVPKTMVYRVARWLNQTRGRTIIPEASLTKVPSAELRPNQTDQDTLPPYDVLDDILQRHIEQHQSADDIIAVGFDPATVRRVLRMVRAAEFKRKQAAPGLKVTDRAFGTGWRMPIAAKLDLAAETRSTQR